ncbi:GCN5-related N-acetyltransferase [Dickeya chrysanthemi Ech1591]|uniref:GCN5-related N-acetyltransferase n=1 Tax=Dickeya chrysanthemi (strain Ech1591) TaxID=561229 RepID=C6CLG9_DICC1|nr:GNAT family N-acetyltransferase [Dickeya chrysanthemi]ACT08472.1 GCN5-related N-acetyltransferase [Dickeya chrysanthemi Ech1591]
MGLSIRKITPDDLPCLAGLCAEHADYERLNYQDDGQIERWRTALFVEPARLFIWVVVDDTQRLRGYMSATVDYSTWSAAPFVYMDCLYLQPGLRGQGVGRRLLDTLTAFAEQHRCLEIQWQTPPDNQLGIGFYQHMGAGILPKSRFSLRKGQGSWKA